MTSVAPSKSREKGFALIAVLVIVIVLCAILASVSYSTMSERTNSGSDQRKNSTFYAAEAGMEKMTADLGLLYNLQKSPTVTQLQNVGTAANEPVIPNASYSEYKIIVTPDVNNPDIPATTTQNISSGPNAGLYAQIVPLTLQVTANSAEGEQVRMIRNVQVALIPVFQFGVFSDPDLSFFPGPKFDFNGRVFTNGNLFLSAQTGALSFFAKVSAVKDVIRQTLPNGVDITTTRTQPVNIPTAPNGCNPGPGGPPACRALGMSEGSASPGPGGTPYGGWVNLSTKTYGLMLQNGKTGTTPLNLPFVSGGATPYEIIRRPPTGEDPTSPIGTSRLYNEAQIRILLDDNPANLPGGQKATDVNLANYSAAVAGVAGLQYVAQGIQSQKSNCLAKGSCSGWDPNWYNPNGVDVLNTPWPLISGWLRVEYRDANGNYQDVTKEWLGLGFARGSAVPNSETAVVNVVHPEAILDFQIPADQINGPVAPYNYYPINLYDPREGEIRDNAQGNASCAVAGVINAVELDMLNLKRWLSGAIAGSGVTVESATQNGYIVYFSDRRGMQLKPGDVELNGEYGFEDVINPAAANGKPNGTLDAGEDVNDSGTLENYGVATVGNGFGLPAANKDPYSTRIANCFAI